jgi:thymidylate synthase (FAD)
MDKLGVLDHGYVRLDDVVGDDLAVVNAARVSFDKRSEWDTSERTGEWGQIPLYKLKSGDVRLINFLASNGHWSPFAHQTLSFEVKCPMLVKNQWIKHRIGMSYLTDEDAETWDNEGWNEMSLRYVSPKDFYVPAEGAWRAAPENKKQGSGENLPWREYGHNTHRLKRLIEDGVTGYNSAIESGVAPEQARLLLPMYAMYTSFIWTTSLYGVIRFLELRTKGDAQYEIRQYADAVGRLAAPHFPETFRAFGLGDFIKD